MCRGINLIYRWGMVELVHSIGVLDLSSQCLLEITLNGVSSMVDGLVEMDVRNYPNILRIRIQAMTMII